MSPNVEREIDRILGAAQKAKKIPGAYCHTAERGAALAKRGFRFLGGDERSWLPARRYSRGAQSAEKLIVGPQNPLMWLIGLCPAACTVSISRSRK